MAGRPLFLGAGLSPRGGTGVVRLGVWAGVSDWTFLPKRFIATSTTLFSFSLLRPMTSDATANAKLPMAAHCVPVNSIPQKFMLWPLVDGARFAGDPAFSCQVAVANIT